MLPKMLPIESENKWMNENVSETLKSENIRYYLRKHSLSWQMHSVYDNSHHLLQYIKRLDLIEPFLFLLPIFATYFREFSR